MDMPTFTQLLATRREARREVVGWRYVEKNLVFNVISADVDVNKHLILTLYCESLGSPRRVAACKMVHTFLAEQDGGVFLIK